MAISIAFPEALQYPAAANSHYDLTRPLLPAFSTRAAKTTWYWFSV